MDQETVMKEFNKEEAEKIESTRVCVQRLAEVQDYGFRVLCEEIGISEDTDVNWMFDYVYNTSSDSPKYEKYVKEKIYGSAQ